MIFRPISHDRSLSSFFQKRGFKTSFMAYFLFQNNIEAISSRELASVCTTMYHEQQMIFQNEPEVKKISLDYYYWKCSKQKIAINCKMVMTHRIISIYVPSKRNTIIRLIIFEWYVDVVVVVAVVSISIFIQL